MRPSQRGVPKRLIAILAGLAAFLFLGRPVYADRVDDLIKQLRSDDAKVRLSAALNLGKLSDKRAIPALVDALSDSDKTVRGIAAAALGKLMDGTVEEKLRDRVITELQRVSEKDPEGLVRSQAEKSYNATKSLRSRPKGGGGGRQIYVSVGPMSDDTKTGQSMLPLMKLTVEKTIQKKAPQIQMKFTDAELKANPNGAGFYVDGTLQKLDVKKTGAAATVSCNLSLLVATYPQKSLFGFARGSASVESGSSQKLIDEAKQDCVAAVVEDVVAKQIVPTIQTKATN
jgi:hypothetical protein